MKYIVKDRREEITLSVQAETAAGGVIITTGRFPVSKRSLELTDAQVELFGPALDELLAEGTLLIPRG